MNMNTNMNMNMNMNISQAKIKHEHQFKFLMIGDSGVGKSSLLLRFADDRFTENYISTIGVDFRFCSVKVDGHLVKLQIWDTAGQERFKSVTSAYYRGADAIIMVYDVSNRNSFDHLQDWLREVNRYTSDVKCKVIVGNKNDIRKEVESDEAREFADSNGFRFIETSAKDNSNIESLFLSQTQHLLKQRLAALRSSPTSTRPVSDSRFPQKTGMPLTFAEYRAREKRNQNNCCNI